jgi:hypothetical protein
MNPTFIIFLPIARSKSQRRGAEDAKYAEENKMKMNVKIPTLAPFPGVSFPFLDVALLCVLRVLCASALGVSIRGRV